MKTLNKLLLFMLMFLCLFTSVFGKEELINQCISSESLKFCTFLNFTISNSVYPNSLDESAELTYKREISRTLLGKGDICHREYKYGIFNYI